MNVRDIMKSDMAIATEHQLISDAIVTLADVGVHGLPVVDGTKKLIGVLSTTDILESIAEQNNDGPGHFLETTTVGEIMTRTVTTITPDADIKQAAQMMLYRDIHRLFVVQGGELLGVVSQSDIVRAVAIVGA